MQKFKKIYLILTYMFFIYPPFIAGLVLIYNGFMNEVKLITLVINLIVLVVLVLSIGIAIYLKKLHIPNKEEKKYLIFGLVGNVVTYLYTFQNNLSLHNIVTIYLVLLIVMGVHLLLISKKFQPLELWILLPIFLVYDYLYVLLVGCGFAADYYCIEDTSSYSILIPLFYIIFGFIVLYYVYKLFLYKLFDVLKIVNIILSVALSVMAFDNMEASQELIMTVVILLPFFAIIDFIVSIVNKSFSKKMLLFYIRTSTLILISTIVGVSDLFGNGGFSVELLSVFVIITYVSLFISILKFVLKIEVKDVKIKDLFKNKSNITKYIAFTKFDFSKLESSFVNYQSRLTFNDNDYNMQVVLADEIIGLLHSSVEELKLKNGPLQARIYFIEVTENPKLHTNELLYKLEHYYKSKGVSQIKYLAHIEEEEIIELLINRGYVPVDLPDNYFYLIKTI